MSDTIVNFLEEICRNASLSKYRHFYAATRNKYLNNCLGIPVVFSNVLLGSIFFVAVSEELPDTAKWFGAFLALGAAVCSGIQTFFNFNKQFEGHRNIANRYLKIAYDCQFLLCQFRDDLVQLKELASHLAEIKTIYNSINEDAEIYPTTERDYQKALLKEKERAEGIGERFCLTNQRDDNNHK